MILLYSRHNYPPQFTDKEQAKRRLRTCPRLHSKQQSEPSDPGLSPKLEAHQADLEEILFKIPFSGTQSDLLIFKKDNNSLLQTAGGSHCSLHRTGSTHVKLTGFLQQNDQFIPTA